MGGKQHTNPPPATIMYTYFGYAVLYIFGQLRDLLDRLHSAVFGSELFDSNFYTRRLYDRIKDCFNRPITGVAGTRVSLVERRSNDVFNTSYEYTGKTVEMLNLASYNYLGMAETDSGPNADARRSVAEYGVSTCSPMLQYGSTKVHRELEDLFAEFLGKESAMFFGMGFGTNSLGLPALAGPGTLIISDALNHTSIVIGARGSGAKVRCFRHNDPEDLESVLRESIAMGQPRTHRPWKKILIIIEGVYSMEGEACKLKEIVHLKKKYKAYLYLDEAHSIGAMGKTGRGMMEAAGVDPADVDICMGTATKSFGSIGGYIAADKNIIDALRVSSAGMLHANALSTTCAQMALSSLKVIMGRDGTDIGRRKIKQLHDNSNYVRNELVRRGFEVLGTEDCPVIPVMLYNSGKIAAFSRECYDRGLAVVVVGFPATSVIESRARLCISAGHTMEELKWAVEMIDEVGDAIGIKYAFGGAGGGMFRRKPSNLPLPPSEKTANRAGKESKKVK